MHAWYRIEPKAPLVFRSGRPFEAGVRDGANFPWPSAVAGLLRTQVMDARGWQPRLNPGQQGELLALEAIGPFLGRRDGKGMVEPWLPKPADAVPMLDDNGKAARYHRLSPRRLPEGAGCDLPAGLAPVMFERLVKGKPQPDSDWWPLAKTLQWMRGGNVEVPAKPAQPWQVEQRTHVGIHRTTFAAENSRLFQTEGLDFGPLRRNPEGQPEGWDEAQWLLLARGPQGIASGAVAFGGERRLSWLEPHDGNPIGAPRDWAQSLAKGFALTLVTPALFTSGWRPDWLDAHLCGEVPGCDGLRVRLRAALVERWQGVSGWDLQRWQPRAARKAVAAGATYWFEILAGAVGQLDRLWLASICDDPQDRRDGFGICLPRPWQAHSLGEP
ncbi:MAG: type III-B CRISPR module-associated protein Cmr3 [Proteobacteria bacterium]|nr:type III-B CRISPR module-associated protein Cmr3 [Pseudomonadota bacterium]